jgi:hypothetical protein
MPNPFSSLAPVLSVLATEGCVLPATGQAIIDLAAADPDEVYDRIIAQTSTVEGIWETRRALYQPVRPVPRSEKHLFRYFQDGSTRTYFIGTVLEHDRSSPVQIAQVGAAAVHREDDGHLQAVMPVRHKLVLMLDKSSLSDSLWNKLVNAVAGVPNCILRNTSEDDPYGKGVQEKRSRGAHKANWAMREEEIALARVDLAGRPQDEWLVVDGGLGNEYLDWPGAPLVGVAKSFQRDLQFKIGSGPQSRTLNLYSLLAGLEEGHRTAVFPRWAGESREGKIIFWYVRIRPQRGLDYPLMGVVKVEMPNPSREAVNSDLVDLISGAVTAERCVTPHGRDSRWHAHLYPISVAERVIKDQFYSEEVLKAAIRWPDITPI